MALVAHIPRPPPTEGAISLKSREYLRCAQGLFDEYISQKRSWSHENCRFILRLCLLHLEDQESSDRHDLTERFFEMFDRERAAKERSILLTQRRVLTKESREAVSTHKYEKLMKIYDTKLATEERRYAEDGLQKKRKEEDLHATLLFRREQRLRQMRDDMQGVHAAQVFLVTCQVRERFDLIQLEERQVLGLQEQERRHSFQVEEWTEWDQMQGTAEDSIQMATDLAVAERRAERQKQELRKEQQKLISRCTHSRNGKSVFAGAFPKKICYLCKIKYDPLLGLLVPM